MRKTLLLALLFAPLAIGGVAESKKLVEFGWDEPDTAFMRAHAAEMERTPFDGCVFHVNYLKDGGPTGSFEWECFGTRAFSEAEFKPAIDDLIAVHSTRFTENFLRFNTSPGDVDWFDDFGPILQNAKLAAAIARKGGCRGVLFDIEQYAHPLFNYSKQRDAKSKTWAEYSRQVRRRGAEVMKAFQEGYPGVTVFLTYSYPLPRDIAGGDAAKLPEIDYGLLAPFLDGMLDAAAGDTKLIDGFEMSYAYQTAAEFAEGRRLFKTASDPFIGNLDAYHAHFSQGFGLWVDQDWRKLGWNEVDVSKNFFTPEKFEAAVKLALKTSDKYVWIYTEQPRWWTGAGKSAKLPGAYDEALRRARASQDH